jgi:ABC-type Na+ efflux pump permease subunit
MSLVGTLIRREALELSRQPVMLLAIAALFTLVGSLSATTLALLHVVAQEPVLVEDLGEWTTALGWTQGLSGLARAVLTTCTFLLFTQYLGIVAVLAGHTILHDRQSGTIPFILLAPARPPEILLGKVIGAMVWPTAGYLVAQCTVAGIASVLPIAQETGFPLPPDPAWVVATFIGGPLWALGVGLLCATISGLVQDVRAAQQGVWFLLFFATLAGGYLVAARLPDGLVVQLGVVGLAGGLTAAALYLGSLSVHRDLGR